MSKYKEFDNTGLNKFYVSDRQSKVTTSSFVSVKDISVNPFIDCLPDILKGKDFKALLDKTYQAYLHKKPIIIGIGGHIIKTGLSPLLIDLLRLNAISGICANGSVCIHDFEIACFGKTSEDVAEALRDGSFGMATDTCDTINNVIEQAAAQKLGYGEAIGKYLAETDIAFPELSLLRNGYQNDVPITVHIAIGTDINHQHETASGHAIGECSMRDFRIFTQLVSDLDRGGVFLCFGSAVIIPEVFLKALTICRNKKIPVNDFTTAVFDMNTQYRPIVNIATRPVQTSGNGYYFVGHHEIMIPLFLFALRERILNK